MKKPNLGRVAFQRFTVAKANISLTKFGVELVRFL